MTVTFVTGPTDPLVDFEAILDKACEAIGPSVRWFATREAVYEKGKRVVEMGYKKPAWVAQ